jgi:hypothetical protein
VFQPFAYCSACHVPAECFPSCVLFCRQPCAPVVQSLLGKLLVHLGDLNAQALSGPLALQWGARVIAEFQAQAALENRHPGVLTLTPYMHDLHTDVGKARLQLGFCKYEQLCCFRAIVWVLSTHSVCVCPVTFFSLCGKQPVMCFRPSSLDWSNFGPMLQCTMLLSIPRLLVPRQLSAKCHPLVMKEVPRYGWIPLIAMTVNAAVCRSCSWFGLAGCVVFSRRGRFSAWYS